MQFMRNKQGEFTRQRKPLSKWQKRLLLSLMATPFVTIASHATFQAIRPTELIFIAGHAEAAEMPKVPSAMDVMLAKIAKCESSDKQFLEDGSVVLNINKDGSADVGKYQINLRYHGAEIARQKLDVINSEEDNRKFAEYLYERNGTADWSASKHCWSK